MKILAQMCLVVGMCVLGVACGSDTTGKGGGSTNQTCNSSHECVNGACTCTTAGMSSTACTDDEKCVDECEVCSTQ